MNEKESKEASLYQPTSLSLLSHPLFWECMKEIINACNHHNQAASSIQSEDNHEQSEYSKASDCAEEVSIASEQLNPDDSFNEQFVDSSSQLPNDITLQSNINLLFYPQPNHSSIQFIYSFCISSSFLFLLIVCDFFWKYYSSIFFSNSKDSQQDQYYRQLQTLFISILCEWKAQRNVFAHYCFLESFFSSSLYTVVFYFIFDSFLVIIHFFLS